MNFKNRYPLIFLSGILIFVGVLTSTQAQGAWSNQEQKKISNLQKRIIELEKKISVLERFQSERISLTIPYIVESKALEGGKGECGSGLFKTLDSRSKNALMTSEDYYLHTCYITIKVNK